jgi:phage tail-like protein
MADTTHDKYLENGRFKVDVAGCTSSKYAMACTIDPMKCEIIECTTGDTLDYRRIKPGATSFGTAKITFHVDAATNNKDLHDWIEAVRKGDKANTRKVITVDLCDRKMNSVRQFHLNDCFPIEFVQSEYTTDTKANEATLTVQIGYVTF